MSGIKSFINKKLAFAVKAGFSKSEFSASENEGSQQELQIHW